MKSSGSPFFAKKYFEPLLKSKKSSPYWVQWKGKEHDPLRKHYKKIETIRRVQEMKYFLNLRKVGAGNDRGKSWR